MTTPTGTAGANQNGAATTSGIAAATIDGRGTPGEVLNTGFGAANSAPTGPDIFSDFARLTVQPAFDLAIAKPLRNKLIWDQFATPKVANLNINGWDTVRAFFGGDIPEDTSAGGGPAPLMENLDVDSVTFTGRSVDITAKEYGRAVSRTRLANVVGQINIDPQIVDRVAFDGSRGVDALARIALVNGASAGISYTEADGTVTPSKPTSIALAATGDTFLSTTLMQVAISILEQQNAQQFMTGNYIVLTNPVGAQHLKNERDTGGFRYVTARNNGTAGNDIYRGTIGMIEGADVVVSNTVPAGKAYLMGRDALTKVYTTKEGYGAQPVAVVAPVVDKLRRFLSWGHLHYVGYKMFDTRALVELNYSNVWRPAGSKNLGADPGAITQVTGWTADFGPLPGAVPFPTP
jgi:hypothetical protein